MPIKCGQERLTIYRYSLNAFIELNLYYKLKRGNDKKF